MEWSHMRSLSTLRCTGRVWARMVLASPKVQLVVEGRQVVGLRVHPDVILFEEELSERLPCHPIYLGISALMNRPKWGGLPSCHRA
jgi:hypothetical protein